MGTLEVGSWKLDVEQGRGSYWHGARDEVKSWHVTGYTLSWAEAMLAWGQGEVKSWQVKSCTLS